MEIEGRANSREGPTPKNLAEVFVEFEPVREDPKDEQEDSKTEQHQCGHDTRSVPDVSSGVRDQVMKGQANKVVNPGLTPQERQRRRTSSGRTLQVSGERAP